MEELVGLFGTSKEEKGKPLPEVLPPEVEEGNVEYKLKLVNPSASRFEHLVTQMKWRLQEGEGEAIYEIGVEDCGLLAGLTDDEMQASLNTLERMAKKLDAALTVLRQRKVDSGVQTKRVSEVLVRKVPENQQFIDLRLAVLGNVDAGKSTLLGVLTHGELDNGRGRARLNLFRHLHEIQSGRTSSISHEILGYDSKGEVINYCDSRTVEEICERSTKLITLIDLCGHTKYLKTTIFGLTGYSPDFAMLVVSANSGMVGTTKEHLGFALALGVPIFVVVTKIDMCRATQVERTVKQLEKILKSPGVKKVPFRIENDDDAVTAAQNFHSERINLQCHLAKSTEKLLSSLGIPVGQSETSNNMSIQYSAENSEAGRDNSETNKTSSKHNKEDDNDYLCGSAKKLHAFNESSNERNELTSSSNQSKSPLLARGAQSDSSLPQTASNLIAPNNNDLTCENSVTNDMEDLELACCSCSNIKDIIEDQHGLNNRSKNCIPWEALSDLVLEKVHSIEAAQKSQENEMNDQGFESQKGAESICPVFTVSSVNGTNTDLLHKFLNVLPPLHSTKEREKFMQELTEHQIDEVYSFSHVGSVACGTILRGTVKENDDLLLGPTDEGEFLPVKIGSIHRNRLPCRLATAGQTASLSVGHMEQCIVRKGMVLVSPELNPVSCLEFEADIYLLFHNGHISKGFQTVIHVGNVMQTAIITKMKSSGLRTNEKTVVTFKFINRPEYIRTGTRLLFREGKTKGMGEVTKIIPYEHIDSR